MPLDFAFSGLLPIRTICDAKALIRRNLELLSFQKLGLIKEHPSHPGIKYSWLPDVMRMGEISIAGRLIDVFKF